MQPECHPAWWRQALIYQVYPRSFQDSDGDGVGDLRGLMSRLDYIASLGVDTLWINPVFASPGKDNGYDINDYYRIQPEYGTMADMEQLIVQAHKRNLRIIIDMILNHTSDRHEWFQQARTSRDNPHYRYYCWWPAEKGKPPYRCGFFDPAGEAWHYNEPTDSWYLHYFSAHQPDLNWDNPEVREQLYAILRFWLDKGFDGFRFDAITFISKDTSFPEISPDILKEKYQGDWGHYYATGPRLHEYLKEMRQRTLSRTNKDILFLGEAPGILPEQAPLLVAPHRRELDLISHFDAIAVGYLPGEFKKLAPGGYKVADLKTVYTRWDQALAGKGWGTLYLGNHDQPRMVTRWGDDSDAFRHLSAKLLFTFLLTMRGTPFLYSGDELAMRNIRFTSIDDYQDIETRERYRLLEAHGGDTEAFLHDQQLAGRDNGRTPFQWTPGPNAGFTTGTPWLRIPSDYPAINRETEEKDPASVLHFLRRLIRIRKQYPALIEGDYSLLTPDDSPVFAYTRTLPGQTIAVLLNFSSTKALVDNWLSLPSQRDFLSNNYPDLYSPTDNGLQLQPWQALVFSCA
jgi:oligo-1,6-glucosidase